MSDAEPRRYYVTTPIYYVNGLPHVGSALTTIACDVLARYHRQRGYDTWLLTGVDENATKVQEAAAKANVPTQEFVDGLADAFQESWRSLHIACDDFLRTTEPRHVRAVQEFFQRLRASDCIYLDTYEGWYSVSDETFFRDTEVADGVAIESGKPVVRVQEDNYFFRLSAFGDKLLAHIEAHPEFLQPDFRKNEVTAFIKEGLRDMSITRANRGWGIPVPGDDSKVIYVWFDALINYLSALGWPDDGCWRERWPADVHFMGKEIFVRFHATLWPAMLMALELPLPKQIYAHGWWTVEGGKKGGKTGPPLPHPTRFARLIADRSGSSIDVAADAVRYLLCREMNFGMDTEFTVENCLRRFNTDLANDIGNLLNRTVNMVGRYLDGTVPTVAEHDAEIAALALQVREEVDRAIGEFRLNVALESILKLVGRMNKLIDERAPWTLAREAAAGSEESGELLRSTLYSCLEATRIAALLLVPFMPVAAERIGAQLGLAKPIGEASAEGLSWGGMEPGTRVQAPQPIFPRIQDLSADAALLQTLASSNPQTAEAIQKEERVTEPTKTAHVPAPAAPIAAPAHAPAPGTPAAPVPQPTAQGPITIDDFLKVELRVGDVLAAEPVPNATKLLRLTVQVGEDDTRTILAGIAEDYQPDDLVGKQVVVVANLQPRKMRGIESQGMLLAADVDGHAILLHPSAPAPAGSRVR
ncbi:MAG TPA: methionine--tRNA ligase [Chthonomonadaceae bacterium]|nr:methionine--tRNA ligase [Chthonomonadaceae bacterium]